RTPLGPHEFEVGQSICQGDSGGPAISADTGAIIGVVSRGGACEDDHGHIYTTTAGFDALFSEAFAVAGGAPVVETDSASTLTRGAAARGDLDEEAVPARAASCAATPAGPAGGGALALALAFALGLGRRRLGSGTRHADPRASTLEPRSAGAAGVVTRGPHAARFRPLPDHRPHRPP